MCILQNIYKNSKYIIILKYSRCKNINRNLKMQNIEKRKKDYFKDFIFKRVSCTPSYPKIYSVIVLLNIVSQLAILQNYIMSQTRSILKIPPNIFLYLQVSLLILFIVFTGLSSLHKVFKCIWVYYLLFMEAFTPFFIRSCLSCYSKYSTSLCANDLTYKILNAAILFLLCFVLLVFKNNTYEPFHNVNHVFAMKQEHITWYLLIFRIALGLIVYHVIFTDRNMELKVIFILAFVMFWKSRSCGHNNQIAKLAWSIYYYFVCWACFAQFISSNINFIDSNENSISNQNFETNNLYFLLFTLPFVICIPIVNSKTIKSNYWERILDTMDHQLSLNFSKQHIFLICNLFLHKLQDIKKSQLKYRDEEFKLLNSLIKKHASKCVCAECPLYELCQNKDQIPNDEFLQQKIFSKTIKCCLDYIKTLHEKLKFKQPNNLQINIEIAYFEFMAFKNKQRGILLFSEINSKKTKAINQTQTDQTQNLDANNNEQQINKKKKNNQKDEKSKFFIFQPSYHENYALYYLKKMIDMTFAGQSKQAQSNIDNQLSQFRQKIEVSVAMLAQFWSLLADPKCNLKKLYDLTNYLFPLKMSLENDWQKIKIFKNIQSYNLYAKYLIRMFNDKQKGLKIFQQAKKIEYQLKNKHEIEIDEKGGEIIQQSGLIFMQYEAKSGGIMYQVNVNAQKLFGYNKGELQNKKVNEIMPLIYAVQHDKILQNFHQTNYSTMLNKQRSVWGKSKNGFLFPMNILIKPIVSLYSQTTKSQVYASIKKQPYIRQTIGIIIDKNCIVQQFTSTALRVFPILHSLIDTGRKNKKGGITIKKINQLQKGSSSIQKVSIRQIFPDFDLIKHKVMVQNEQYELSIQRQFSCNKHEEANIFQQCVYNIQINQIKIKISGCIGFIIKLSKIGGSNFEAKEKPVCKDEKKQKHQNDDEENQGLLTSVVKTSKKKSPHESSRKQGYSQNDKFSKDYKENGKQYKDKYLKVKFTTPQSIFSPNDQRKFIFSYNLINKSKLMQNFGQSNKETNKLKSIMSGKNIKQKKRESLEGLSDVPYSSFKQLNKDSMEMMKYIGGNTRSLQILNKMKYDTQSSFRAQLKVSQMKYEQNKVNYGIGIKTKRLLDKQVREMREQQDEIEYKNIKQEQEKQEQNNDILNEIKPSELSLILQKSSKNKLIFYLRIITVLLLIFCSIASIVQFAISRSKQKDLLVKMNNAKRLLQISTEVSSINFYTNYLCQNPTNNVIDYNSLQQKVGVLNDFLNQYSFQGNANIVYNDGSSNLYLLGFALNKLISSVGTLQLNSQGTLNVNDSSTFFVRYNTINGIQIGLQQQQKLKWKQFHSLQLIMYNTYIIFIIIVVSVAVVIVFIKNLLIRVVVRKKTQILQIFFQIPRVSCSIIQKQCEKFILRLSTDNEEEELDILGDDQMQESNQTSQKAQKKRSIVGEENTTTLYMMASFLFVFALLSYQFYMLGIDRANAKNMQILQLSTKQFFNVEFQLFKQVSYMGSYSFDKSMPISEAHDQLMKLASQQQANYNLLQNIRASYFNIKNILESKFGDKADSILYYNLCGSACSFNSNTTVQIPQQKLGLNSILSKYFELIRTVYINITKPNSSTISNENLLTLKQYEEAMKKYWRQLTLLISTTVDSYYVNRDIINIWVLVVICVINLAILMVAWLKYYWNLQQKINATEYILTFIPIDEINKNKKIAAYIKKQILSRK